MNGYHFDLSCPSCGASMAHEADGAPQAGTRAMALCRCTGCGRRYSVETVVRRAGGQGVRT